jgi:hypothetical protein
MFYKFLDTKDVDRVLRDGTLKVSSLRYFRDLESAQGSWIGDRLEGATELTTPKRFTLTEGSPELELANQANIGLGMVKKFAHVSGGSRIKMGGVRFIHQVPNLYIYSFSHGELGELKNAMCVEAQVPYSACLNIEDPAVLLDAIMDQGEVLTTAANVRSIFKQAVHRPVMYKAVIQDIRTGPVIAPSPFQKAAIFAPQREHRMLFDPVADDAPDTIVIKIPHPENHFHEVFRDFKPLAPR